MSTQRRRVLEDDGGKTIITDNGVYIEGLNGKFYTIDTWASGKVANSVVVVSSSIRFRMALTDASSEMAISSLEKDRLENYMTAIYDETSAKSDYDGAGNTAKIMQMQPSTEYAAGYCNAFTFPDGKTKGFLPSLGQLNLAYENKAAVDAALVACGGAAMLTDSVYSSSTFYGIDTIDIYTYRYCWGHTWGISPIVRLTLIAEFNIRPFADLS